VAGVTRVAGCRPGAGRRWAAGMSLGAAGPQGGRRASCSGQAAVRTRPIVRNQCPGACRAGRGGGMRWGMYPKGLCGVGRHCGGPWHGSCLQHSIARSLKWCPGRPGTPEGLIRRDANENKCRHECCIWRGVVVCGVPGNVCQTLCNVLELQQRVKGVCNQVVHKCVGKEGSHVWGRGCGRGSGNWGSVGQGVGQLW